MWREIQTSINVTNIACDKCTILMWDADNRKICCRVPGNSILFCKLSCILKMILKLNVCFKKIHPLLQRSLNQEKKLSLNIHYENQTVCLLKCRFLGPIPGYVWMGVGGGQHLHFNKHTRWFLGTLMVTSHCPCCWTLFPLLVHKNDVQRYWNF